MHRLYWQEGDKPRRELVAVETPLGKGDVIRMLEPIFVGYDPLYIISTNPDADIINAHFKICWQAVFDATTLFALVYRVEAAGWLSAGKSTQIGSVFVERDQSADDEISPLADDGPVTNLEYVPRTPSVTLGTSVLGKVSSMDILAANVESLRGKLDEILTILRPKTASEESLSCPPTPPAGPYCATPSCLPRALSATLGEELVSFDRTTLRRIEQDVNLPQWKKEKKLALATECTL